jgi:hypothetical protein
MPNTDEQIADGSHSAMGQFADGRKPITGAQVNQLKIDVENLISVFEMLDGELKKRILNIAVNGQARF